MTRADSDSPKATTSRPRVEGRPRVVPTVTFGRVYTTEGVHPYDEVTWERRDVVQTNWKTGETVFEQRGVEFPDFWSVNAYTIVTTKYFRGAIGTEQREHSLRQLIDRVVLAYGRAGREYGYFATEKDAEIFEHELTWMLLHQVFSFNSPVWFNVGTPSPQQVSACFILSVDDTMDPGVERALLRGLRRSQFSGGISALGDSPMADITVRRDDGSQTQLPSLLRERDPFRGREVFKDKGCIRCHSVWGHGGTLGPEITVAVAGKTWDELVGDFWNHTPRMIDEGNERGYPWPMLERGEMADILSYLYYLRLFDEPADPGRGSDAYARLQCASCHTLGGAAGGWGARWTASGSTHRPSPSCSLHAGQVAMGQGRIDLAREAFAEVLTLHAQDETSSFYLAQAKNFLAEIENGVQTSLKTP